MSITAGHNYWFSIAGINGSFFTLRYADGMIPTYFPSTSEAVTLLGGQANTVYPGLFNWYFSHPSVCARTPAVVTLNCILPVNWLSLEGSFISEKAELHWTTEAETNNNFFLIQRSSDGLNFETIGKLSGNGTTSLINQYSFVDTTPYSELSYYRIVQYDLDGRSSYSKVITLSRNDIEISISPNPSKSSFTVTASAETSIKVTDLLGREILSDSIISEMYSFGSNLPGGTYIVSLMKGNLIRHTIIIKE